MLKFETAALSGTPVAVETSNPVARKEAPDFVSWHKDRESFFFYLERLTPLRRQILWRSNARQL